MDPVARFDTNPGNVGLRITVYNEIDGSTTDLLFKQFPVRIGRNKLNDLVLAHQYVSQWHAAIGFVAGQLSIVQVGSSNAVQVEGHRMKPSEEKAISGSEPIRIVPFTMHLQLLDLPGRPKKAPREERFEGFENSVMMAAAGPPSAQNTAEQIALRVIERMGQRFLGRPPSDPQEIAAFGVQVETSFEVFLRCFVALQKGQAQFKKALDIKTLGDGGGLIESARDGTELGAALLGGHAPNASFALEQAFKDIMVHQVALLNGLMAGVRSLLEKLSPEAVMKEASRERRSPNAKLLYETYQRMHHDLAEEDNEAFETIFGKQFGRAYSMLADGGTVAPTSGELATLGYPPSDQSGGYPPAPGHTAGYPPAPDHTAGYPPAPDHTAGYPPAPDRTGGYAQPAPDHTGGYAQPAPDHTGGYAQPAPDHTGGYAQPAPDHTGGYPQPAPAHPPDARGYPGYPQRPEGGYGPRSGYDPDGYAGDGYGPARPAPNGYGPEGYGPDGYGAPPPRQQPSYDASGRGYRPPPPPGPHGLAPPRASVADHYAEQYGYGPHDDHDYGPPSRRPPQDDPAADDRRTAPRRRRAASDGDDARRGPPSGEVRRRRSGRRSRGGGRGKD